MSKTNNAKIKSKKFEVYPSWCGSLQYNKKDLETILNVLFYLLSLEHINPIQKSIRETLNKYYGIIERKDGFYYGTSKAFVDLINETPNFAHKDVVVEHAVPANVLISEANKRILNKGILNTKELDEFFKKHYYVCLITIEEDIVLNNNHLKKSMPSDWTGLDNDWKKRYDTAGINLTKEPGKL